MTDKKISSGLITYWIACIAFIVFALGYVLYNEAVIFSPSPPTNLEELVTWSESDLLRLLIYYNCSDAPSRDIPDDLKEFVNFCDTVRNHWSIEYDKSKYIDAREGAKKLRQE